MEAVMVGRFLLTVLTRRKTVTRVEKGVPQTMTRTTMTQMTLASARVDQAIGETVP